MIISIRQAEFLKVLCEETGQRFDPKWDKSEASKRIDAMQKQKAVKRASVQYHKCSIRHVGGQHVAGSGAKDVVNRYATT